MEIVRAMSTEAQLKVLATHLKIKTMVSLFLHPSFWLPDSLSISAEEDLSARIGEVLSAFNLLDRPGLHDSFMILCKHCCLFPVMVVGLVEVEVVACQVSGLWRVQDPKRSSVKLVVINQSLSESSLICALMDIWSSFVIFEQVKVVFTG